MLRNDEVITLHKSSGHHQPKLISKINSMSFFYLPIINTYYNPLIPISGKLHLFMPNVNWIATNKNKGLNFSFIIS